VAMTGFVETLAKDEGLRREMGAAGRAFIREHLTSEQCTQAYLDLYRAVIDRWNRTTSSTTRNLNGKALEPISRAKSR